MRLRALARIAALCAVAAPVLRPAAALPASPSIQVFVEPGAHVAPVLSLIRSARRTLRLEVYLLTDRSVVAELARARGRGVDVRVLLEEHPFEGSRYAQLGYNALHQAGVPVRWANEGAFRYTHEKALEVDERLAGILTLNLTSSGIFRNREFGVLDASSEDAQALAGIFDADWNRRPARVSDPHLAVSPVNSRADLTRIVDGARSSLDIYAEEVDDASMENRLAAAVRRGVRARLITSNSSPGVSQLMRAGIAVRLMPSPYVHAKAIVADGRLVFIGSENISTTSLDQNREVGIVLADRGAVSTVESTFTADWRANGGSSGAPPTPTSAPSGKLRVRVTVSPPSARVGESMTVSASTAAGATCRVRVTYPDGYVSRARALSETKTAGAGGEVAWSWHVGSKVRGTGRAAVSCELGGASATGSASFEIR